MQLIHIRGDALTSPEDAPLVHCISHDGALSAGFALHVHARYKIRHEIQATHRSCPGLVPIRRGKRLILNLITKRRYFDKPTLSSLRSALILLRNFLDANGILCISTVGLGSGLDRLNYHDVLHVLSDVFSKTNVIIHMYHI